MDSGGVAVVGAQVVAVTAIVAGFIQQRRSFDNERQLADRESVRLVLSEGATLRHKLEAALDMAKAALSNERAGLFDGDVKERPYRDLDAAAIQAERLRGQMEIRLGPEHPVTLAFADAVRASRKVEVQLSMIKMKIVFGGGWGDDENAEKDFVDRRHVEINSQRKIFDTRVNAFVELAHDAAGARL